MLEIRNIPQMWIQVSHDANDCLGGFIAFFLVFYGDTLVYHFLYMPAIFWDDELRTLIGVF